MAAPKTPMTKAHKQALAAGRAEGKIVRDYLEALKRTKPKRGRKRTPESIKRRLNTIKNEFENVDAVTQLKYAQERLDLAIELAELTAKVDIGPLEKSFVKIAKGYGERNGITYSAWREIGVDATVLKRAGITR
ncbi:unannotated protein [freshwater metagenome]|uniref:Unannotated protein n=1 Tax=freshwater metagenome TaxID=449393 RepID=A0A6J6EU95_9ZZZZ|nr:hypothetical protein [Actinomycetota bacterium]